MMSDFRPTLTDDQIRALGHAPFKGLHPESPCWSEVEIHGPAERPGRICDGTDVAALLVMGLMRCVPLEEPWPVGRHPNLGEIVASHRYVRTRRGDRALVLFMTSGTASV